MTRIIAVVNQKGGVGKSTTVVNLGAALARTGKRILLIDMDPQGNTTSGIGIDKQALASCVYDCLVNSVPLKDVIVRSPVDNLDAVPATIRLAGAEIEMVSAFSRELRLKEAIGPVETEYSYILVDCPPSLGLLTVNSLVAAKELIIPIQCEYYALEGLGQLMTTVEMIKRHLNKEMVVSGVLLTMFDQRTNLSSQVAGEVREYFKEKVFKTVIPRNVKVSEAPSFGQPVLSYDARCSGARAYLSLAKEVVRR